MSDRHLRRLGQDYGSAFLTLLPQGQAWPKHPGTTLDLTCRGLAEYWGFVDSRAADLLERESDPRITIEMLTDWERNWGLPDPCYQSPQSIAERQLALIMRMTMQGGQSRQFFIDVAAMIGYTITISEYRTFVVGIDRIGDARVYGAVGAPDPIMRNDWGNPIMNAKGDDYVAEGELSEWPYYGLGPDVNRLYWTVHVADAKLVWFRCASGQCGVDPHLRIGLADDLECLLNRWKPAHTQIIFDYSGLESGSPGGPPPDWVPEGAGVHIDFVGDGEAVARTKSKPRTGEPPWVPVDAYAHIDFMSGTPGRAWLRGTGDVAINTLLGTDANTTGWQETLYDPSKITVDGYVNDNDPFALIGAARTKVLGDCTMQVRWGNVGDHDSFDIPVTPFIKMPSVAFVATTFNPADLSNVTLSAGNLVATIGSGVGGVRATSGLNSGKYYWENTYTTLNSNGFTTGISVASASISGGTGTGIAYVARLTGQIVVNGTGSGTPLGMIAPGSVIGVAVDFNNRMIWFRVAPAGNWNGSSTADPATDTGGISINSIMTGPPLYPHFFGQTGDKATANFGASAFVGVVPFGFRTGWPASTAPPAMLVFNSNFDDLWVKAWATNRQDYCDGVVNRFTGEHNVAAWTITTSRGVEMVVNGKAMIMHLSLSSADLPDPLVAAMMDFTGPVGKGFAVQSITIYDTLPDYVGLFALTDRPWTPNARAWVQGVGEVPVESVVGTDPNTVNVWGDSGYDSKWLTPDGYIPKDHWPPEGPGALAFIGVARAKLIEGSTFKFVWKDVIWDTELDFVMASAESDDTGVDALEIDTYEYVSIYSWNGDTFADTEDQVIFQTLGAINAYAATIVGMRFEAAANGNSIPTNVLAITLEDLDRPAANPLICAFIDPYEIALRSVTIQDPLPSIDGLVELSFGVSHDVLLSATITFEDAIIGSVIGQLSVTNFPLPIDSFTFTLPTNPGGLFDVIASTGELVVAKWLSFSSGGTYNIAVTVTSSNGPPLTQAFTITVFETTPLLPPTLAVLDYHTAGVEMAHGNRAATKIDFESWRAARSNTVKKSGKWYFEARAVRVWGGYQQTVGITSISVDLTTDSPVGSVGASVNFYTGDVWTNGAIPGPSVGPVVTGDIIDTAVDLTLGKAWFRKNGGNWNGSPTANPATNVGGITIFGANSTLYAPVIAFWSGEPNYAATECNFGETAYTYPAPSGFANWPVPSYATFDGTPSASIVLSNGNRTVVHGTTNNGAGVQSTTTLSVGAHYFEMAVLVSTAAADGFGVKTNLGGTFVEGIGTAPNGVGVALGPTTKIYHNGIDSGKDLGATAVNDVFCAAINLTTRLAWFRRNGGNWNADATADPTTGTGGVSIPTGALSPYVRFTNTGATNNQTANFGQAAFAFAVPSGFTAGWPGSS